MGLGWKMVVFKKYTVNCMNIDSSCNYDKLRELICTNLKINPLHTDITIKFKVQDNFPAFIIENDINLDFYRNVKQKEADFMKFPLCITTTPIIGNHMAYEDSDSPLLQNCNNEEDLIHMNSTYYDNEIEESDSQLQIECPISYFDNMVGITSEIAKDAVGHTDVLTGGTIENTKSLKHQHDESTFTKFEMNPEISINDEFKNKHVLKYFLSHYALKNNFNFKVKKSNRKNYWVNCISDKCDWMLKASAISDTDAFKVRKFEKEHSCTVKHKFQESRQLSSNFIATMVRGNFKNSKTKYGPLNIKKDVHDNYSIEINYQKAWRSKERATEQVLKNLARSYGDIPTYLHLLEKANPGSYTRLEIMRNGIFLFAFIALAGCIEGWNFCRPQVVVDGAFLKESYGGTLLTACTYNAAGRIMPLAFAIVDSENNKAWEWFFGSFRKAFGYRDGMCIITDRHESIKSSSRKVYPEAGHYFCIYHILNNLKVYFKKNGDDLRNLIFVAAKAYTERTHQYYIRQLKKLDDRVITYLEDELQKEEWVAIYAKEYRRQAMTSNIAESCNARNNLAREMPITTLLEQLRSLIQEWSHKFKILARNTTSTLTEKYEEALLNNMIESKKLKLSPVSEHVYNVFEGK